MIDYNSHYEKFADGTVKCIDDEIPFEIPQSWEWVRLGAVVLNRDSERIPLSLTERGKQTKKVYDYYGPGGAFDKVENYIFDKRLLLIGEDGANLLTRSKPNAFFASGKYWVNNHVHVLDSYIADEIILDYIALVINCISLEKYVTGTAQPKMNQEKMNTILIPLPPITEEKNIIKKVGQLDPLLKNYDSKQEELENLNLRIKLLLRKSILQEAIKSWPTLPKLQFECKNCKDEPASNLLQRIRVEKERLIKEKKIKRDKQESVIFRGDDNCYYEQNGKYTHSIQEEIPFEIPDSWIWVRGKSAFLPMTSKKPTGDCFIYIDLEAVDNKRNYVASPKLMSPSNAPSRASREVRENDILFSMVRPYLRNIALISSDLNNAIASTGFYVIRPSVGFNPKFLFWLMMSGYVVDGLNQFMKGDNSPSINNSHIEEWLYPLPPIQEQERIAAKIEQLFQMLK